VASSASNNCGAGTKQALVMCKLISALPIAESGVAQICL
jgi:hypothetical protein